MGRNCLETFSNGIMGIIIVVMILKIKTPICSSLNDILKLWPQFETYALSFFYVGLYWTAHYNLFHKSKKLNK